MAIGVKAADPPEDCLSRTLKVASGLTLKTIENVHEGALKYALNLCQEMNGYMAKIDHPS